MLDGGGRGGPWFAAADNPVARDSSFLTRTCTFFYLPVYNALLLLWPSALSFDWSMDAIAPVQSLTDPRNVASITFYATLIALGLRAFGRRHKNPLLILALGLLILPFIPASNLFFYVGFVVAERVLYLPSAGYCLLLAVGLDRLLHHTHRRRRRWIQVSLLITVFFWSLRTARRNADWTSEERLYRSAIGINPAKGQLIFFFFFFLLLFLLGLLLDSDPPTHTPSHSSRRLGESFLASKRTSFIITFREQSRAERTSSMQSRRKRCDAIENGFFSICV